MAFWKPIDVCIEDYDGVLSREVCSISKHTQGNRIGSAASLCHGMLQKRRGVQQWRGPRFCAQLLDKHVRKAEGHLFEHPAAGNCVVHGDPGAVPLRVLRCKAQCLLDGAAAVVVRVAGVGFARQSGQQNAAMPHSFHMPRHRSDIIGAPFARQVFGQGHALQGHC
jgi:hypothetical protein